MFLADHADSYKRPFSKNEFRPVKQTFQQNDNNTFFTECNKLLLQKQQTNDSNTCMLNAAYR